MMKDVACGFLDCTNAACKMVLVTELGTHIPCCDNCGMDRQDSVVKTEQDEPEPMEPM